MGLFFVHILIYSTNVYFFISTGIMNAFAHRSLLAGLVMATIAPASSWAETYVQATLGGASDGDITMPFVANGLIGRHLNDNLTLEVDVSMSVSDEIGGILESNRYRQKEDDAEAKLLSSSVMLTRFISLSKGAVCSDLYLKTGLTYSGLENSENRGWMNPLNLRLEPSVGFGFRYGLQDNRDFVADLTHTDGVNRLSFGVSRSF